MSGALNLQHTPDIRCLLTEMPGVSEDMPFGPQALVYKILNKKMFALLMWNRDPLQINLKCDPNQALILRSQYPAITPGYHMNKQHWNTVTLDNSLPAPLVLSMIRTSYDLVTWQLTKAEQRQLSYLASGTT